MGSKADEATHKEWPKVISRMAAGCLGDDRDFITRPINVGFKAECLLAFRSA